jgi:hypothetical protein
MVGKQFLIAHWGLFPSVNNVGQEHNAWAKMMGITPAAVSLSMAEIVLLHQTGGYLQFAWHNSPVLFLPLVSTIYILKIMAISIAISTMNTRISTSTG